MKVISLPLIISLLDFKEHLISPQLKCRNPQKWFFFFFFLEYSVLGGSPELVAAAWRVWMQWSSSVQAWLRTTLMSENKIAECSQGYNRGWVKLAISASDPAGNEVMGEFKVLPWGIPVIRVLLQTSPCGILAESAPFPGSLQACSPPQSSKKSSAKLQQTLH